MSTRAELAEEPRFALLIGLMERLTGREVEVVPPATMVLGRRKTAHPTHVGANPPHGGGRDLPTVSIRSVRPAPDGDSYRVGATYRTSDRGGGTVEIEVDRSVIEQHAQPRERTAPPLRIEVDRRALYAGPDQPLLVRHRGSDAVHVSADRPHVDVDA